MSEVAGSSRPRLRPGCRLGDSAQQGDVLLIPEGVLRLVGPGRKIVERCDGQHTFDDIVRDLLVELESSRGSFSGTNSAVSPSETNSGIPPCRVVTSGRPLACASSP